MNHKLLFVFLTLLLVIPITAAVTMDVESITLLAVTQTGNGSLSGSTATMYLQAKPGTGAIFIESYPASKIDTQVATRVANEIACEFTDVDCRSYDFFYTIRADSPIIGGPSGGAATAVLTLAVLEEIEIRDDIAMTGAISSGGIIGPVDGIKEKIMAAQEHDKSIAIIPKLAIFNSSELNQTNPFNISNTNNETENETSERQELTYEDLENFTVQVSPVITIYEALDLTTKKTIRPKSTTFQVSPYYEQQMNITASELCERTQTLLDEVREEQTNSTRYEQAMNFINKSKHVAENEYYSKASFCFSANLQLRQLLLENVSQEILLQNYIRLNDSVHTFRMGVDQQQLRTLADLEAYVVVTERLLEAQDYLDLIDQENISYSLLGLGIERYASAVAWSGFFGLDGSQEIELNEQSLAYACSEELRKVESRLNYLRTFLPESYLREIVKGLDLSYDYQQERSYAQCLFKATKTKADANLFLSSLAVEEEKIPELIQAKRDRTETVLAENKDRFAILGYSYYQYAESFIEEEPYSGLSFAEYGLAFSDVSGYFPAKKRYILPVEFKNQLVAFVMGMFVGAVLLLFLLKLTSKKSTHRRKRK